MGAARTDDEVHHLKHDVIVGLALGDLQDKTEAFEVGQNLIPVVSVGEQASEDAA